MGADAVLTLVAASLADMVLAGMVADALEQRLSLRTRVIQLGQLQRRQNCHALVSQCPADQLILILNGFGLDRERLASSGMVLVHPQPGAELFALAQRRGLVDVVRWPQDLERWCAGSNDLPQRVQSPLADNEAEAMQLLGSSEAMHKLRNRIARIAAFDSNVLLMGETGTGKERVAQAIHARSQRRDKPMVSLNCAALPEHLIESELFGYERGAFTGAHASHPGKFGMAEGGTLFLDEIGEMPRAAQAKILRVIESREFYRLGGARPQQADVRLIAATHCDLEAMCASNDFRLDLFFRLNVARLDLPALRDRADDIVPLAEHFLREGCRTMKQKPLRLTAEVQDALRAYAWPGNVRELRNAMEIALINSETACIELEDLPPHLMRWAASAIVRVDERAMLVSTLKQVNWNKSEAARVLNWSRMKLYRKLHHYELFALTEESSHGV